MSAFDPVGPAGPGGVADRALPAAAATPARPLSFSPLVAAVTVAYLVGVSVLCYEARAYGISRHALVVPAYVLGVGVFFGALWAARGVAPWRLGRETLVVTGSMLVFLTLFLSFGRKSHYELWFGPRPDPGGLSGMAPYFFFVGSSVVARIVLPLLTGWLVLRRGPLDYGWGLRRALRQWWLYVLLVAIIIPAVIYASTLPSFLREYPWCRDAIEGGTLRTGVFALYAAAALAFFISGEAFWRGWLLLGTERELGRTALFLMLIPYVVGHFGKPLPETLGAILAGLVLGGVALYHRSFWLGALTHWSVAMAMDLAALWRKGVEFV